MSVITKKQKAERMYARFGKDEKHQCRDCCHRYVRKFQHDYAKCEVYSDSASEASDWGSLQPACGLWNKETDLRNVFFGSPSKREEQQSETLF